MEKELIKAMDKQLGGESYKLYKMGGYYCVRIFDCELDPVTVRFHGNRTYSIMCESMTYVMLSDVEMYQIDKFMEEAEFKYRKES